VAEAWRSGRTTAALHLYGSDSDGGSVPRVCGGGCGGDRVQEVRLWAIYRAAAGLGVRAPGACAARRSRTRLGRIRVWCAVTMELARGPQLSVTRGERQRGQAEVGAAAAGGSGYV